MKLLRDKVVLITGGSKGIGSSIVDLFYQHGALIAFTYFNTKLNYLTNKNYIKEFKCDVASFEETYKLVKKVICHFGKIDILINNAGIIKDSLLLKMTEKNWDSIISNNLKSVFNVSKHSLRQMLLQKHGIIINISSIIGICGASGQSNYAASKAGIIGFSKSIAKEFSGKNIRINVIAPGFIYTDMTKKLLLNNNSFLKSIPINRYGTVDDIAYTALFLASNWSSYINGQVISVCGGINL